MVVRKTTTQQCNCSPQWYWGRGRIDWLQEKKMLDKTWRHDATNKCVSAFSHTVWPSGGNYYHCSKQSLLTSSDRNCIHGGFHEKHVGWCPVWLMILIMYLKSLSVGQRWVSWNMRKSSDQNANSVVGSHHNLLLQYFRLDNVIPSQVCSLSFMCYWFEFTVLFLYMGLYSEKHNSITISTKEEKGDVVIKCVSIFMCIFNFCITTTKWHIYVIIRDLKWYTWSQVIKFFAVNDCLKSLNHRHHWTLCIFPDDALHSLQPPSVLACCGVSQQVECSSIGLRSGDWLGQSRTFHLFTLKSSQWVLKYLAESEHECSCIPL